MSKAIIDLHLEDLPGIKSHTLTKLRRIGIDSVLELAVFTPQELAEAIGDPVESLFILVIQAKKMLMDVGILSQDFCTAADILTRRKEIVRCTTGSKSLDGLLQGGIESQ